MFYVFLWTILFSIVTVVSITLMGSRDLIGGQIDFIRILKIILDWKFLLGAFFAFLARLFFIMVNNALYNIPELSNSSTTITAFITSVAMIFVIIANYYFLNERISFSQGLGAFIVLIGIFFLVK